MPDPHFWSLWQTSCGHASSRAGAALQTVTTNPEKLITQHGTGQPSSWLGRWAHLLPAQSTVLDIACGHGRHMKFLASLGHQVTGIDRSPEAIDSASAWGEVILADIENGPWPLTQNSQNPKNTQSLARPAARQFGAVVVTNYLWRPLFCVMAQSLAPSGILIYETFARGNETVGKPSRPDFLLEPGELIQAFSSLHLIAYECGFLAEPARFVQRMVAVMPQNLSDSGRFPSAAHPPYSL